MKDIKFRAWNGTEKQMISWHSVKRNFSQYLNTNRKNTTPIATNGNYNYNNGDRDCYILMQYLGHKDISGQELYEGDIIEYLMEDHYEYGKIIWNEGRCQFDTDRGYSIDIILAYGFKIIGNIYETPPKDIME